MSDFINSYQIPLLFAFFGTGILGTITCFRQPAGSRAWKLADLVWVVLGGFGALAAVMAGIYREDSSRIERQIDIAYAASHEFDGDAARFRLRYCLKPASPDILTLCEKVEFLSASTAENSGLPLFLTVTGAAAPLQGLHYIVGMPKDDDMSLDAMMHSADNFDPAEFLAFDPRDTPTRAALANVRSDQPAIAADYQILANAYDDLITQVGTLKSEWEFLQANSGILLVQIIALCLVAFAAPFRLGKSIVELRRTPTDG